MSKQPDTILIFAAGFGKRMGVLAAQKPKPMVPVAGTPMIDLAIKLARDANLSNITVNLHYKHQMLAQYLSGQDIKLSLELPTILDTGGGLRHALPLIGTEPVYTLNPDAIWRRANPLAQLAKAWDPGKMDALLMLIPVNNAIGHAGDGDFQVNQDGTLSRGASHIYSGAQILKTSLLQTIPETAFSLNRMWDIFAGKKSLYGVSYTGSWCDVGTPQGIRAAESLLKEADV